MGNARLSSDVGMNAFDPAEALADECIAFAKNRGQEPADVLVALGWLGGLNPTWDHVRYALKAEWGSLKVMRKPQTYSPEARRRLRENNRPESEPYQWGDRVEKELAILREKTDVDYAGRPFSARSAE